MSYKDVLLMIKFLGGLIDQRAFEISALGFSLSLMFLSAIWLIFSEKSRETRTNNTVASSIYFIGCYAMAAHILPPFLCYHIAYRNHTDCRGILECVEKSPCRKNSFYAKATLYHAGFLFLYLPLFIRLHSNIHRKGIKGKSSISTNCWLFVTLINFFLTYCAIWYWIYYNNITDTCDNHFHSAEYKKMTVENLIFLAGIYLTLHPSVKKFKIGKMVRWGFICSTVIGIGVHLTRQLVSNKAKDKLVLMASLQSWLYIAATLGPMVTKDPRLSPRSMRQRRRQSIATTTTINTSTSSSSDTPYGRFSERHLQPSNERFSERQSHSRNKTRQHQNKKEGIIHLSSDLDAAETNVFY